MFEKLILQCFNTKTLRDKFIKQNINEINLFLSPVFPIYKRFALFLYRNDKWSICAAGYFLNGLYKNDVQSLSDIQWGHCCKPSHHPVGYGSCYTEDVRESFEREVWTNCSKLGYYITGVYRGSGDWLKNIDKFRCCQMASGNEITCKILYGILTDDRLAS